MPMSTPGRSSSVGSDIDVRSSINSTARLLISWDSEHSNDLVAERVDKQNSGDGECKRCEQLP